MIIDDEMAAVARGILSWFRYGLQRGLPSSVVWSTICATVSAELNRIYPRSAPDSLQEWMIDLMGAVGRGEVPYSSGVVLDMNRAN